MSGDLNFELILEELKRIHDLKPDLRFGALLQTSIDISKSSANYNLHDISSKQILSSLKNYHEILKRQKEKEGA